MTHSTPQDTSAELTCTACGKGVDKLEVFPQGRCLACHAASAEGQRLVTGDELVAMWGGPARKRRRS